MSHLSTLIRRYERAKDAAPDKDLSPLPVKWTSFEWERVENIAEYLIISNDWTEGEGRRAFEILKAEGWLDISFEDLERSNIEERLKRETDPGKRVAFEESLKDPLDGMPPEMLLLGRTKFRELGRRWGFEEVVE